MLGVGKLPAATVSCVRLEIEEKLMEICGRDGGHEVRFDTREFDVDRFEAFNPGLTVGGPQTRGKLMVTTRGLKPGVLAYIPILVCGTCGFQGVLDPVRYCDNRVSLQVFRGLGWQSEIADDEHPTRWWRCPKCAEGEG